MEDIHTQPCSRFSLSEVQIATHQFDEELVIGRGGFGKVYKGSMKIGATHVPAAIKRLNSNSSQGASEFWAEVQILSKLRHCNVACLIGYCTDANEMILVYEYIPQGTLEACLDKAVTSLSWFLRLNICIGASRGLDYLHTGTGTRQGVIHRDVKTSNILLDENYEAKIADFGLAKVGRTNQTHTFVATRVKGTFGYIDPSYFYTNKLTRKSDVYAFGVVMLEVLCGRPAVDTTLHEDQWGLAAWARARIKEGKLSQIIDSSLRGQISSNCLKEFARIAVSCLHNHANKRPTMAEVVAKLQFALYLQKKMDPNGAKNKVIKKVWSLFTAKVPKLNNSLTSCLAIRDPDDFYGNPVSNNTPVGSVGSIVDAGYDSGAAMVHFDDSLEFTLSELLAASAMCLYENPYWKTYVANLADGSQVVVKRILTHLSQNNFVTAVSALGKIRHTNVLDLKAYYRETGETLCVFKFLPMGVLLLCYDNQDTSITTLGWPLRIKIILGITRGVYCLHTQEKIVHGDLKLSNIMLDEKYNPMIANAGLAQLMPATPQRFRNNCAPEFKGSETATAETDIYSLGIIMLELLTGESTDRSINPVNLPRWVKSVPKEMWSTEVFKVKLVREKSINDNILEKIMTLALQCVEYNSTARPTIKDVLWALEQIEEYLVLGYKV